MEIMQDCRLDDIAELFLYMKILLWLINVFFSYQIYIEIGRGEMFCLSPTFIWFEGKNTSRDSDAYTGINVYISKYG